MAGGSERNGLGNWCSGIPASTTGWRVAIRAHSYGRRPVLLHDYGYAVLRRHIAYLDHQAGVASSNAIRDDDIHLV